MRDALICLLALFFSLSSPAMERNASFQQSPFAAETAPSFFEGASYTPKVLKQMQGGVGEFHSFPESVTAFEKIEGVTH